MKEFSLNLGLPAAPLTSDEELAGELQRVYSALRNMLGALDRYTGAISPPVEDWSQLGAQVKVNGMCKVYYPAKEAITPGQTLGFVLDAGVTKVLFAKDGVVKCRGFCSNTANASIGDMVEVTLFGLFAYFAPGTLTRNNTYYQSATFGTIGAAGAQAVGYAITDSILFFNPVP